MQPNQPPGSPIVTTGPAEIAAKREEAAVREQWRQALSGVCMGGSTLPKLGSELRLRFRAGVDGDRAAIRRRSLMFAVSTAWERRMASMVYPARTMGWLG